MVFLPLFCSSVTIKFNLFFTLLQIVHCLLSTASPLNFCLNILCYNLHVILCLIYDYFCFGFLSTWPIHRFASLCFNSIFMHISGQSPFSFRRCPRVISLSRSNNERIYSFLTVKHNHWSGKFVAFVAFAIQWNASLFFLFRFFSSFSLFFTFFTLLPLQPYSRPSYVAANFNS